MNRNPFAFIFSFILAVLVLNLSPLAAQAEENKLEWERWVRQSRVEQERDDQTISYVHDTWKYERLDPKSKEEDALAQQAAQDFLLRGMLPSCRELIIEPPMDDFSYPTIDDEGPHAGSWG